MRHELQATPGVQRPSRELLSVFFLACLALGVPDAVFAARGRPHVSRTPERTNIPYATLVTDNGTLLRGSRWSSDLGQPYPPCPLPNRTDVSNLRSLGFNALHLYGEAFLQGYSAGACRSTIDTLVDWTDQDGLYLILTIGNGTRNGSFDAAFATAFWNFYGPRYAARTHVIYEIQNEPYFNFNTGKAQPSPASVRTFERDMYNLLRSPSVAPNTPILLMSYAVFKDAAGVQSDVNALTGVDWSNAAIAFHGYASLAATESTLQTVVTPTGTWNGVPCIQTEFIGAGAKQDVAQTLVYEDHFTSWLTFVDVKAVAIDANYKTLLDQAWVIWSADHGSWPATSPPPVGQTIALRAAANGKWVTATSTGLTANKDVVGVAEKYQVVRAATGYFVGLKAQVNGKFVEADPNNSYFLGAFRTFVGKLEWMERPDGTVVLRAFINNKIVSADLNLFNPPKLIANRKAGGPWERFVSAVVP